MQLDKFRSASGVHNLFFLTWRVNNQGFLVVSEGFVCRTTLFTGPWLCHRLRTYGRESTTGDTQILTLPLWVTSLQMCNISRPDDNIYLIEYCIFSIVFEPLDGRRRTFGIFPISFRRHERFYKDHVYFQVWNLWTTWGPGRHRSTGIRVWSRNVYIVYGHLSHSDG